jgi:hypothetical protein
MCRSRSSGRIGAGAARIAVLLGLLAVSGCGDGRIPLYPVTGSIVVDGKPADGAMVIFCPQEGQTEQLMRERPVGFAGNDGKYQLTTFVSNDGAPAGQYKVLIQWPLSNTQQGGDPRGGRGGGPDRLRGRYFNLERTTLTATINEAPTEIPAFQLTSK